MTGPPTKAYNSKVLVGLPLFLFASLLSRPSDCRVNSAFSGQIETSRKHLFQQISRQRKLLFINN